MILQANLPQTREEWKRAGDAAELVLRLHLARHKYGLITPDGQLIVERAEWLLGEATLRESNYQEAETTFKSDDQSSPH